MKITSELVCGVRVWRAHRPGETRDFDTFDSALEWGSGKTFTVRICECGHDAMDDDDLCGCCTAEVVAYYPDFSEEEVARLLARCP